jgi:diacylglycerol kinase family enzyme
MNLKKALIIFNPTAGIVTGSDTPSQVKAYLQQLEYSTDAIILDNHFEDAIAQYDFTDVALVVAVGGDGTVRVAARTILEYKIPAPLAIIPFGSANVVAASLNIPISIKKSLALIKNLHTQKIDVGKIDTGEIFLVGFSIGYISKIVTQTQGVLKNRFGFLGYIVRFLFNNVPLRRIKFKITCRDKQFYVKGNSLVVFNAVNIYGIRPKKNISITDGVLNLYVVKNRNFIGLFKIALDFLFYQEPPHHLFALDGQKFGIDLGPVGDVCQIDGDLIALGNRVEITMMPQALSVVVLKT